MNTLYKPMTDLGKDLIFFLSDQTENMNVSSPEPTKQFNLT